MERVRFIDHDGTRILHLDLSGLSDPRDADEPIRTAQDVIAREPEQSVLTLTDVEGSAFDADLAQALWRLARANKPYVKAAALVGVDATQRDAVLLVQRFSGRRFAMFHTAEDARAWLVAEGKRV